MSDKAVSPIFIHSLWRSGSTYIFNVFRRSTGYYCYQEPLNEIVFNSKDSPEYLLKFQGEIMQSLRHPELNKPYFQEMYETCPFWKNQVSKPIIYDQYFSSISSENLKDFYSALIESSQGIPVIQECRTSNRIKALKNTFGGRHLVLCRNPWDQWWSFKSTAYFDVVLKHCLNANSPPKSLELLKRDISFVEFHGDTIQQESAYFDLHPFTAECSYLCFYMFWCLAWIEARQYGDLIISLDQITELESCRHDVLEKLHKLNIEGLDLSDCHIHQTRFMLREKGFFENLEDRVYGYLLTGGTELELVEAIREYRKETKPIIQRELSENATDDIVFEDAVRCRDIVLRLETESHHRINSVRDINAQQLAEQERIAHEKFDVLHVQMRHLVQDKSEQERALSSLISQVQEDKHQLSEQFLRQLIEQERTAQNKLETLCSTMSVWSATAQDVVREQEQLERIDSLHLEMRQLAQEQADRERALQHVAEQQKAELLQKHVDQLQSQQKSFDKALNLQHKQQEQLKMAATALEAQLRQQFQIEQNTVMQLQQSLEQYQLELKYIRSSFSWWLTAPLRMLSDVFMSVGWPSRDNCLPESISVDISNTAIEISNKSTNAKSNQMVIDGEKMANSMSVAKTVNELLSYHNEQFVHCAYITLLGRSPDQVGLSYYLDRLATGLSNKAQVLVQLVESDEAKNNKTDLPGLYKLIAMQKKCNHWFWRIFYSNIDLERHLNRLEYELGGVVGLVQQTQQKSMVRFECLEKAISTLQATINNSGEAGLPLSEAHSQKDFVDLTPSAQKIYVQLKNVLADSAKNGGV